MTHSQRGTEFPPPIAQGVREELRRQFMDIISSDRVSAIVIEHNLDKASPVVGNYVRWLEDSLVDARNRLHDPVADTVVAFGTIREMMEHVSGKPLTAWQNNQCRRWEDAREAHSQGEILVLEAKDNRADDRNELEKKLEEKEQEIKALRKTNDMLDRQKRRAESKAQRQMRNLKRRLNNVLGSDDDFDPEDDFG